MRAIAERKGRGRERIDIRTLSVFRFTGGQQYEEQRHIVNNTSIYMPNIYILLCNRCVYYELCSFFCLYYYGIFVYSSIWLSYFWGNRFIFVARLFGYCTCSYISFCFALCCFVHFISLLRSESSIFRSLINSSDRHRHSQHRRTLCACGIVSACRNNDRAFLSVLVPTCARRTLEWTDIMAGSFVGDVS